MYCSHGDLDVVEFERNADGRNGRVASTHGNSAAVRGVTVLRTQRDPGGRGVLRSHERGLTVNLTVEESALERCWRRNRSLVLAPRP